jgi:hypothetical protein
VANKTIAEQTAKIRELEAKIPIPKMYAIPNPF